MTAEHAPKEAKIIMGEILDYFLDTDKTSDDAWCFSEDGSEFGLDHQSEDGTKFWLNLSRDGAITILWKPFNAEKPNILKYKIANRAALPKENAG